MKVCQRITQVCEKYANNVAYVDYDQTEGNGIKYFELESEIGECITIECVAQAAAYLYIGQSLLKVKSFNDLVDGQELASHVGYLAGVNNFKFLKLVVPGDILHISLVEKGSQTTAKIVQAKVVNQSNDVVANGRILVTQK
ncbi:hypothetical protein FEZ51_07655 [Pediococcus stilesii]|uniref:Beta-hydroxyacyl-ACP dehydratase n=1 Tax=Pediococcus stilesii TaxID=331679 RepID=A0A5R9BT41_9LACO|nr:hypothetical protein [Pediococcus stilesii]TLQ03777.1 hypothetical protein FEZ51_07655 [Pediococcus stilesii]